MIVLTCRGVSSNKIEAVLVKYRLKSQERRQRERELLEVTELRSDFKADTMDILDEVL